MKLIKFYCEVYVGKSKNVLDKTAKHAITHGIQNKFVANEANELFFHLTPLSLHLN